MEGKTYPKLQYSYFMTNGTQVVIRGENIDEWIANIDGAQEKYQESTKPQAAPAVTGGEMCAVHNKPLKSKVSKTSGKPYKAHYRKDDNDEWDTCFGKGWMSEKDGQSSEDIAASIS